MSALHDEAAEQALLGACIAGYDHHAYGDAAGIVTRADFWRPAHELIWQVLTALHTAGSPVDPIIVERMLRKAGVAARIGNASGGGAASYLAELVGRAALSGTVKRHAEAIADAATMRRLATAGQRIAQRAEESTAEPAELVQWAAEQVAAARDERAGVDVLTVDWASFLHRSAEAPPAVIPGLLGEGDRLVLTGSGGLGKSTLLQQIAMCAAAGVPPLDYDTEDPFEPVKTMIFDCENPDHKRKTRLWPIMQGLVNMGCDPRPHLTLGGNGASFDLLNPANALSLLRTVEHDKPRLVYIGPVYKLHNDDPDKESVVKKITGVLDGIREMGVSLITEAHPNKGAKAGGPMSPSGSALWEWWPEYGVGLRLDPDSDEVVRRCKLERWRIDRDESQWPLFVEASGDPALPWRRSAITPGYLMTEGEGDRERF